MTDSHTQAAQQVGSRTGLAHRATESPRVEGSVAFLLLLALIGGTFREHHRTQGRLVTTPPRRGSAPLSPGVSVFPSAWDSGYLSPDLTWFLHPLPSPREEPSAGQCPWLAAQGSLPLPSTPKALPPSPQQSCPLTDLHTNPRHHPGGPGPAASSTYLPLPGLDPSSLNPSGA